MLDYPSSLICQGYAISFEGDATASQYWQKREQVVLATVFKTMKPTFNVVKKIESCVNHIANCRQVQKGKPDQRP